MSFNNRCIQKLFTLKLWTRQIKQSVSAFRYLMKWIYFRLKMKPVELIIILVVPF